MDNKDIFDFFKGFKVKTKDEIITDYVLGKINKEEFIMQMDRLNEKKNV